MDLGRLFRDAWQLFSKDIGQLIVGLLLAAAIPGIAAVVIVLLVAALAIPGLVSGAEAGEFTGLGVMSILALAFGIVAMFAVMLLVGLPLYAGVLAGVLRRVREGRVMSFWDAFSGFRILARVVSVYALAYLAVPLALLIVPVVVLVLGAVLSSVPVIVAGAVILVMAGLVLAYLTVCWTYALIVVIDRPVGARVALRESRELVHRVGWWWTLLALFLLQIAVMAISVVAGFVPLAGAAVSLFTAPFALTYRVAMYFQTRREGWLIEAALATPAPAPGPAAGTWPAPPSVPPDESGPVS